MEVEIKALAYKGKGLASMQNEGKTIPVFVKGAVPGDKIKARITKKHKKYTEAEIDEFIERSKHRIKPSCEHFGICGGCHWLNIEYKEQLKYKTQMLKAVLQRNNKNTDIEEIIPAGKSMNYRIRAKYRAKGGKFGFYKENSNEITDIKECKIADQLINKIAGQIKEKIAKAGGSTEIEIIKNASKEEVYIKAETTNSKTAEKIKEICETSPDIKGYNINNKAKKETEFEINGLRYHPECFTQVNTEQNKKMTDIILEEAEGRCLDLYCGIGNFTILLAKKCVSVTGVEGDSKSAEYARKNSANMKNVKISNMPVEKFLDEEKTSYETTILDPSRRSKSIDFDKLKTKKIIYVSCNPEQLSKDLKILTEKGWKIKKIQPIDMFPQTYHIETISILENPLAPKKD